VTVRIDPVEPVHAQILEALHGRCFPTDWSAKAFHDLLTTPGTFGFLAVEADLPVGYIVLRCAADEAEILIVGTDPSKRRGGIASRLLDAGIAEAAEKKAATLFLEVAEDNPGAVEFYLQKGFEEVGRRPKYYERPNGSRVDARLFKKAL